MNPAEIIHQAELRSGPLGTARQKNTGQASDHHTEMAGFQHWRTTHIFVLSLRSEDKHMDSTNNGSGQPTADASATASSE